MHRVALVLLLASLAAGCSGGKPHAFASCGESRLMSRDGVTPAAFDCLARAYRHACAPVEALVVDGGVDTSREVALRLYARGDECAADVVLRARGPVLGTTRSDRLDCDSAFLVSGGSLILSRCGDLGMITLRRERNCRAAYAASADSCASLALQQRIPGCRRIMLRLHRRGC